MDISALAPALHASVLKGALPVLIDTKHIPYNIWIYRFRKIRSICMYAMQVPAVVSGIIRGFTSVLCAIASQAHQRLSV